MANDNEKIFACAPTFRSHRNIFAKGDSVEEAKKDAARTISELVSADDVTCRQITKKEFHAILDKERIEHD